MLMTYVVVIAETEGDLVKRLDEWKDNMENRGMTVNMNKTKVMISEICLQCFDAGGWVAGIASSL